MIYIEQGEESLQQIVLTLLKESLQQIVSGIYDPNTMLQNLSEQDICFDSNLKESIDRESNAVDLYAQRDSKGQMSSTSFKFSANSVAPSNEVWNIGDIIFALILAQLLTLTAIQQL